MPLTLAVLVTTYRREEYLRRCLEGLVNQSVAPDEIVVVVRDSDRASRAVAGKTAARIPLRILEVSDPGVIAANNRALPEIRADIVSFIDDDAVPEARWVEKIRGRFGEDPGLGALGGRDRLVDPAMREETERPARSVGRVRWYGRIVGNHHRRFDGAAPAETLKGCNMSFRRGLIDLCDSGLRGTGVFYETDLCFQVASRGYRILFDGSLVVDHHVQAPSFLDGRARAANDPERAYNESFNRARVLARNVRGPRGLVVRAYAGAVAPALSIGRFLRRGFERPLASWAAAFRGGVDGLRSAGKR